MKKFLPLFLIASLLIPGSALASHDVWLKTPGDGKVTTNHLPYFQFDYLLRYSSDEYKKEYPQSIAYEYTNDFDWGTFQLAENPSTDAFGNYFNPIIYKPFLDEFTTYYSMVNEDDKPLKFNTTYYWKYCVSATDNSNDYSEGFHTTCSYSYTLNIVKSIKRVKTANHERCKNKKYHKKNCKGKKYLKRCTKLIIK